MSSENILEGATKIQNPIASTSPKDTFTHATSDTLRSASHVSSGKPSTTPKNTNLSKRNTFLSNPVDKKFSFGKIFRARRKSNFTYCISCKKYTDNYMSCKKNHHYYQIQCSSTLPCYLTFKYSSVYKFCFGSKPKSSKSIYSQRKDSESKVDLDIYEFLAQNSPTEKARPSDKYYSSLRSNPVYHKQSQSDIFGKDANSEPNSKIEAIPKPSSKTESYDLIDTTLKEENINQILNTHNSKSVSKPKANASDSLSISLSNYFLDDPTLDLPSLTDNNNPFDIQKKQTFTSSSNLLSSSSFSSLKENLPAETTFLQNQPFPKITESNSNLPQNKSGTKSHPSNHNQNNLSSTPSKNSITIDINLLETISFFSPNSLFSLSSILNTYIDESQKKTLAEILSKLKPRTSSVTSSEYLDFLDDSLSQQLSKTNNLVSSDFFIRQDSLDTFPESKYGINTSPLDGDRERLASNLKNIRFKLLKLKQIQTPNPQCAFSNRKQSVPFSLNSRKSVKKNSRALKTIDVNTKLTFSDCYSLSSQDLLKKVSLDTSPHQRPKQGQISKKITIFESISSPNSSFFKENYSIVLKNKQSN
ncbi:hypothetical protein BB560_006213 [Smittium megazygosporum]|uniref:Uncharacterized protein n=1 Tax=Smittium megazygosporum TaxID=133381 RepID=A0A2T9YD54_9FUNG|nr:hypothetical protein BB560_006213 [Smittium megazygosporum]